MCIRDKIMTDPEVANKTYIEPKIKKESLLLFDDIKYSEYDHQYWDNKELEEDEDRIVLP